MTSHAGVDVLAFARRASPVEQAESGFRPTLERGQYATVGPLQSLLTTLP
jgi:hypothetical protein